MIACPANGVGCRRTARVILPVRYLRPFRRPGSVLPFEADWATSEVPVGSVRSVAAADQRVLRSVSHGTFAAIRDR